MFCQDPINVGAEKLTKVEDCGKMLTAGVPTKNLTCHHLTEGHDP